MSKSAPVSPMVVDELSAESDAAALSEWADRRMPYEVALCMTQAPDDGEALTSQPMVLALRWWLAIDEVHASMFIRWIERKLGGHGAD